MADVTRLYHFTCSHGRREIGTSNCLLLPQYQYHVGKKLVWLTSNPRPDRARTGLTSQILQCDRLQYRYVVESVARCRRWLDSPERAGLSERMRHALEVLDNGEPAACEEWWISDQPLRARFDRSWRAGRPV